MSVEEVIDLINAAYTCFHLLRIEVVSDIHVCGSARDEYNWEQLQIFADSE